MGCEKGIKKQSWCVRRNKRGVRRVYAAGLGRSDRHTGLVRQTSCQVGGPGYKWDGM